MSHVSLPCMHCSRVHRTSKEFSKLCHSHVSWHIHARDISQYVAVFCSVLQCTLVDMSDASCHTYELVTRTWLHHIFKSSHVCSYHIQRKHTVYNRLLPPLEIPPPTCPIFHSLHLNAAVALSLCLFLYLSISLVCSRCDTLSRAFFHFSLSALLKPARPVL